MEKLAVNGGEKTIPEGLTKSWPIITQEDKDAVLEVLDRGILCGPYAPQVKALEKEFSSFIGAKYCISTNSGTTALHTAVAATGIGPGDEVITSAFTFLASALAVIHHNAVPIFVDIDPRTFTMNVSEIEDKITERTKGIIPVHIHGLPAEMDEINKIASEHDLTVIEDAAQAHGAEYHNKKAGNLGSDMAIFSLQASKNMPCGEGGLLVTNSEELRDRANRIKMFGENIRDSDDQMYEKSTPLDLERDYRSYVLGWMYRTQELPAALARSQLKRLEENNRNSIKNANYLTKHLSKIDGLTPPYCPSDRTHIYHKYRVRLEPEDMGLDIELVKFRDTVVNALKAEGVEVVLWQTIPLPEQPFFQSREGYGQGCPWTCPHGGDVKYGIGDYPETGKLLDSSMVIGSQSRPIFPQPIELMEYYLEAIEKVFGNVESII